MRETNWESWNSHPAAAHKVRPTITPPSAQASAVPTVRARPSHSVQKSLPKSNSAMLVSSRSGNANPAIATTSHTTKFSTTSATVAVMASR